MSEEAKSFISTITLIMIIIAIMCTYSHFVADEDKAMVEAAAVQVETEITSWEGQYTIFKYEQNGWTNHFYVTEFYVQNGLLHYKLRDNDSGYLIVDFQNCFPVPGWVEDATELMNYGYWEPVESDW